MFLPRPSMSGLFTTTASTGEGAKSRRALLLMGAMLAFLTMGAAVFSAFEFDQDKKTRAEIAVNRKLMHRKYNFTKRDFALLERVVVKSIPFAAGSQWQFLGALYFCTVVITTIGYGHSTPITVGGKLFCMMYALGGIPLGLIMFQSVGERINHFIGLALCQMGRWLKRKRDIDWLVHVKSRHLLCVSFAIGCVTISVATCVFHQHERWSVFNSAYYCLITLSTIGFGDYVPAQTDQRLHKEPFYLLFTLFFILFGLAIFSACINLLVLECMAYNADMVTARTRLKRMLSARITSSFRIVTGGERSDSANYLSLSHFAGGPSARLPPAAPPFQRLCARSLMRRACAIRRGNDDGVTRPPMAGSVRKHGVVVEKIETERRQKCRSDGGGSKLRHNRRHRRSGRRRRTASLSLLRDIYRTYCWTHPSHFTVRRLPTPYIEHLVNTTGCPVGGTWENEDGTE
ncbi:hypothetical protein niasHT_029696 [Heterodera trifolii]|uniref:Potassium channel domain-containing protein n=1 Tax=Heterodera trifolii TaxID=157864 RepID=A0ABD2KLA9_9BILA